MADPFLAVPARLRRLFTLLGQDEVLHVSFAAVRRPAALSRLVGVDLRGFKHAVSNQAVKHVLDGHGNAIRELKRGQRTVVAEDFAKLAEIVGTGAASLGQPRPFGPPRVVFTAIIPDVEFHYVGEVRRRQRRIDMITMWKI